MRADESAANRKLMLLILSSNHWPTLRRVAARIASTIDFVQTGQIVRVDVATPQGIRSIAEKSNAQRLKGTTGKGHVPCTAREHTGQRICLDQEATSSLQPRQVPYCHIGASSDQRSSSDGSPTTLKTQCSDPSSRSPSTFSRDANTRCSRNIHTMITQRKDSGASGVEHLAKKTPSEPLTGG